MRFADDEAPGHCWHRTNTVLTSNPPQYPEICCLCGANRRVSSRVTYEQDHGPYVAPTERHERIYYYSDGLGDQPCIATN